MSPRAAVVIGSIGSLLLNATVYALSIRDFEAFSICGWSLVLFVFVTAFMYLGRGDRRKPRKEA